MKPTIRTSWPCAENVFFFFSSMALITLHVCLKIGKALSYTQHWHQKAKKKEQKKKKTVFGNLNHTVKN